MPRPPKYPGLQPRYEQALGELLTHGRTLKAREILEAVRRKAKAFGISREELDDLDANFANYTERAKATGMVVSSGPWGGYRLSRAVGDAGGAIAISPTAAVLSSGEDSAQPSPKQRQHWESFLHLPLTVALSSHFSGRVTSLSNALDTVKWGNPDMLMLRPSPLAQVRDHDADLDPDLFNLVDVTPECILASIEIKGGLDRDRGAFFSSIAEAAANSRWANEAWLVFVDWNPVEQGIDEDVVSLARSVEVGLLEVRVWSGDDDQDENAPSLRTVVHHLAPTRATLRVGELTRDRVGVLRAAQALLRAWQRDVDRTFLDVAYAKHKARVLIQQALHNLRVQRGFSSNAPLAKLIAPLATSLEDRKYIADVLHATLEKVALAAGVEVGSVPETIKILNDAADEKGDPKDTEALRRDLAAFGA
jgi:hypothetical protein